MGDNLGDIKVVKTTTRQAYKLHLLHSVKHRAGAHLWNATEQNSWLHNKDLQILSPQNILNHNAGIFRTIISPRETEVTEGRVF